MPADSQDVLVTLTQQQADTQRFLGRIESSLESIQHQYNQTNENIKISFDTLNKRITDTNVLLNTSLQEIRSEKEHLKEMQEQHDKRLMAIEMEKERTKGALYSAKIILGLIASAVAAIAGFLINYFMKLGG